MEAQSPKFTLVLAYETSLRTSQNTIIFIFIVIGISQLRSDVNSYDDKYIVSIMTMIVALSQQRNTREKANKESDTVVMKCWNDRLFSHHLIQLSVEWPCMRLRVNQ